MTFLIADTFTDNEQREILNTSPSTMRQTSGRSMTVGSMHQPVAARPPR